MSCHVAPTIIIIRSILKKTATPRPFGSVRFGTVGGEDEMNAARAEHATRYDEAGLQHNTILALVDRRIS